MSATRDTKKKEDKGKSSLAQLLSGNEGHAKEGHHDTGSGGGSLVGSIGAGLGKFFGNLLPAGFKSTKITDTATQIVSTPLGGKMVGTYTSTVEVVGAPEVIQAIEEANEETERAAIEADAEIAKAKIEAGKADEEDE